MKEQEWLTKIKTMLKLVTKLDYEKVHLYSVHTHIHTHTHTQLHIQHIHTITIITGSNEYTMGYEDSHTGQIRAHQKHQSCSDVTGTYWHRKHSW